MIIIISISAVDVLCNHTTMASVAIATTIAEDDDKEGGGGKSSEKRDGAEEFGVDGQTDVFQSFVEYRLNI